MGTRNTFPYRTSFPIRTTHPTDVSVTPRNPLDNTSDASTATYKLYDAAVDEVLTATESQPQTVWSVTNAGLFKIGHVVEITQDDGTIKAGTLTAVDPTVGTITSDTATDVDAATGNQVRRRLGPEITMSEYGTPALGKPDWGFVGVIPSNHAGLVLGLEFDVEVSFVGAPGGGLDLLQTHFYVVTRVEDCD